MQVLCKASAESADTSCTVCGQGFVLYWERHTRRERAEALREIKRTLSEHHSRQTGAKAHPDHGFLVPVWTGPTVPSATHGATAASEAASSAD